MTTAILAQVEVVPWFVNLGKPTSENFQIKRIHHWDDWPGPEDPGVAGIHLRQQDLFNAIIAKSYSLQNDLEVCWEEAKTAVFRHATKEIPFEKNQDAWHGPTSAVWHAAWTAGLMAICLLSQTSIPSELEQQWHWFSLGHWPCAWEGDFPKGRLIVF